MSRGWRDCPRRNSRIRGAEEEGLRETHVDSRLAWLESEVGLHSRHKGKEVAGRVDAAPHTTPL